MNHFLSVRSSFVATFLLVVSITALAATGDLLRLVDRLDQMDKQDFQSLIEKANGCTRQRDFVCADQQLKKAGSLANEKRDKETLALAVRAVGDERGAVAREKAEAARQEAVRLAQIEREEKRREVDDRRAACESRCGGGPDMPACMRGLIEPHNCRASDDGSNGNASGNIFAQQAAKNLADYGALANIHNNLVRNLQAQQAERQNREQQQREEQRAQQQRAEADRRADQQQRTETRIQAERNERERAQERAAQEAQERATARTQERAKLESQRAKQQDNDKIQSEKTQLAQLTQRQSAGSNLSSSRTESSDVSSPTKSDNSSRPSGFTPRVVNTSWYDHQVSNNQTAGWCAKWTKKIRDDFQDSKNELIAINTDTCSCKLAKNSVANSTKMLQSEYSCEFSYSYRQNVPGNSR